MTKPPGKDRMYQGEERDCSCDSGQSNNRPALLLWAVVLAAGENSQSNNRPALLLWAVVLAAGENS